MENEYVHIAGGRDLSYLGKQKHLRFCGIANLCLGIQGLSPVSPTTCSVNDTTSSITDFCLLFTIYKQIPGLE